MRSIGFVVSCVLVSASAWAKTPDGQTPAEETVCDGLTGADFGLCNAYCEAMDCDSESPHASERACEVKYDQIVARTGGPPPCESPPGTCEVVFGLPYECKATDTLSVCLEAPAEKDVCSEEEASHADYVYSDQCGSGGYECKDGNLLTCQSLVDDFPYFPLDQYFQCDGDYTIVTIPEAGYSGDLTACLGLDEALQVLSYGEVDAQYACDVLQGGY